MAQMAAFLPMIMAGAQAAVGMMSGAGQARDQARAEGANATALEQQAGVTARETSLAEEAKRRQTRADFGELRAAGAEAGVSASNSFADAYSQAATAAELDALNIRYEGMQKRAGLIQEAEAARQRASAYRAQRRSMMGILTGKFGRQLPGGLALFGLTGKWRD